MANQLFKRAYEGTVVATSYANILLDKAIQKHGKDYPIAYPETAYRLPVIFALSGEDVKTLGDLVPILNRLRSENVHKEFTHEAACLNGEATAYAAEIIEALGYIDGDPFEGVEPWTGFVGDPDLRKTGIQLVDFTIPGVAVILGKARTTEEGAALVKDLQGKGMMIFLCNEIIEQCIEANVKIGVDYYTYPLGNFTQIIHAANFALRAGLAFGGIKPGEREAHLDYQKRRIRAFVLALGEQDEVRSAAHFACNFIQIPIICDQPFKDGEEEIEDWYYSEPDYNKMVQLGMELRGIKLKIVDIDVPITIGPAFEGESIRKADMFLEMGGGRTEAFELVKMVDEGDIEDGKVTVHGPEIDQFKDGDKTPFGLKVKIYGRKMQEDFEGVLERRIHYFINYGEGIWHVAQRDINWLRISKEAAAKGFKFEDYGKILIAKFKDEFPAIVDRVEVEIFTDAALVTQHHEEAKEVYKRRDARLDELTDENVEELYSCTLCQSFAPNHCCVVSPERVGLCGAVSWLDAKASFEITPTGPNQPIKKEDVIDDVTGRWGSVNDFMKVATNGTVEEVALYSFMEMPMTSCGCFEAIMAIVPEANGLMITTREHSGETPVGMTFSTLAGTVGGGVQSPGFMGFGRSYINSKKFISAEGGIARIIWMPKSLKEYLGEDFIKRSEEEGLGADFIDKIADETIGVSSEEILPFLEEKGHPALTMDSLL